LRHKVRIASSLVRERRFPLGDTHLHDLAGLFCAGHNGFPLDKKDATMFRSIRQVRDHRPLKGRVEILDMTSLFRYLLPVVLGFIRPVAKVDGFSAGGNEG
jgi:hypothetical protein